jgi:quercetin dioxygenase-like cupin family protein
MTSTGMDRELPLDDNAESPIRVQHVYDFSRLDRTPQGPTSLEVTTTRALSSLNPGKSSTAGPVLTGRTLVCTLGRQPAGTGAGARSQSEQFKYVLQGTMMSDIEGDRVFASKGMILHIPRGVMHTTLACPDDDLVFLTIADARDGMVDTPADAKPDGPDSFPGYGARSAEPRVTTSDILEQSMKLAPGPGKRYVYDMRKPDDASMQPASAEVTPDAKLRLPPGISGKLLTGERLHAIVLRLEPGASLSNYRKDNEQFVFAAEGEVEVDLEDEQLVLPKRCVLHIPKGIRHELAAPHGALIVIGQDKAG